MEKEFSICVQIWNIFFKTLIIFLVRITVVSVTNCRVAENNFFNEHSLSVAFYHAVLQVSADVLACVCDLDLLNETSRYKLFCRSWSVLHCLHHLFIVKSRPPGAMHLRQRGTILFYQRSDMNLINTTLLLAHFLITSNISCVLCVPMSIYFMIFFVVF